MKKLVDENVRKFWSGLFSKKHALQLALSCSIPTQLFSIADTTSLCIHTFKFAFGNRILIRSMDNFILLS